VKFPVLAALLAALGAPFVATPADAQNVVPIEQEPRHVLKFHNAHVRFFDVTLPPGYESLWHHHRYDGVFVNIGPSRTRAQDLGGEPAVRPPRIVGETYFIGYAAKPNTHRVANVGDTDYRVTDTEIVAPCGGFQPTPDVQGQTLVLENERVRVTRLMIAPGERLALPVGCGMLVSVSGGRLRFIGPDSAEDASLGPAGYKWRDQRSAVSFVNTGSEVFHGVDIVVK
jgi:hypothetical protein